MHIEQSAAKRAVLEKLLEQGMVLVTLDTRADTVQVPDHLGGDPQLRLNLSYRFGLPMDCDDTGVTATLTFQGVPFECYLPWKAIYMLVSHATGQPFLFPADIPDDANAPDGAPDAKSASALRVVSSGGGDTPVIEASAPPDDSPEGKAKKRAHLRVVK